MDNITGYISQIIGPVVDVHFEAASNEESLPRIHDALKVDRGEGRRPLVISSISERIPCVVSPWIPQTASSEA